MINEYLNIKDNNKDIVIIIKYGLFYNAFNEDAIIISYLSNYKLFYNNDYLCVSFTDKSLYIVLTRLRVRNINYIVINKEKIEKYIGNINDYDKNLKEASLVKERELLINKLIEKIKNEETYKLKEMLKIIERM